MRLTITNYFFNKICFNIIPVSFQSIELSRTKTPSGRSPEFEEGLHTRANPGKPGRIAALVEPLLPISDNMAD